MPTATASARKRSAFVVVLCVVLWLLIELICLGGLWALARFKNLEYRPAQVQALAGKHRAALAAALEEGTDSYLTHDARLGWTIRPRGANRHYRANGAGLRADREYAAEAPAGRLRIGAFGDSFTHASDVSNGETWEDFLEREIPHLEVLNFGVPAYGLDQAYLRYLDPGVRFHPDIVFIGFMSENIARSVNTYRPFYFPRSGVAFAKPRFVLQGSGLRLQPNPLPTRESYRELLDDPDRAFRLLGRHDYFYQTNSARSRFDFLPSVRFAHLMRVERFERPLYENGLYNVRSEAYEVVSRTFDLFVRDVRKHQSLPVIVLFPQRRDLRARRDGRPVVYQPLRDSLRRRGYLVVDLLEAFARYDPGATLVKKKFNHYPPAGNQWVAQYLGDWLTENDLLTRESLRAAAASDRSHP